MGIIIFFVFGLQKRALSIAKLVQLDVDFVVFQLLLGHELLLLLIQELEALVQRRDFADDLVVCLFIRVVPGLLIRRFFSSIGHFGSFKLIATRQLQDYLPAHVERLHLRVVLHLLDLCIKLLKFLIELARFHVIAAVAGAATATP